MKYAVTLLALLLAGEAFASELCDGYLADGYVYRTSDGYWWKNGIAYTGSKYYYTENSYNCGNCYPRTYCWWRWTPVYSVAAAYSGQAASYTDPSWRSKLLDIAAARDRIEGQLRLSANEQNQFIQGVQALGLGGNFAWQNYGLAPGMAQSYHYANPVAAVQLGTFGANGNSLYGYSYSSAADVYGATDANLLYQQAAALAKNSQDLGGQATSQFSGLVEQAGNNRARVAEILAKGQTAKVTLDATNAAPSASVKIQSSASGTAVTPTQPAAPLPPQPLTGLQVLQARCASCHTDGKEPKGELALFANDGKALPLSIQTKSRLHRRVAAGQMPPKEIGPLPIEEQKALFEFLKGG